MIDVVIAVQSKRWGPIIREKCEDVSLALGGRLLWYSDCVRFEGHTPRAQCVDHGSAFD